MSSSLQSTNFYVVGGTLGHDAQCYVERRADQHLYEQLVTGRFCYVLTARQMGKSSLMIRTAARLRKAGISVAVLDLTAVGQNLTARQWYGGLLIQLGQRLGCEDELIEFWKASTVGPLQHWFAAIREVILARADRVVIFIDEIDTVRSLPFATDEFFGAIRDCYNRRSDDPKMECLTFCLMGVAAPTDLIRDKRTTPFNIGECVELDDFTANEAAPLARGFSSDQSNGAALLKRVLYWTSGHPYLTQALCKSVASHQSVKDDSGVDRLCDDLFFSARARERDDNLLFVRERILRSDVDVAALLEIYRRVRNGKVVADD